ncbi:hypothetical protein N7478_003059 [Penicillium angulare]|uniref:uncharacterized protein n=1 Tax=Penicillium angulare TaxID=116970 RepID=UPI00253F7710|nr:uncharacterized protein N7478_003059 [Penicillium angulare]KAJ5287373.1 hypothetical protein N7478_003059 [Penicillium angulare]
MLYDQRPCPLDITITGAGISGLSTALALSNVNREHKITVLESNASLSEFGAGVQLYANSTRLLDKWGLTSSLPKVAFQSSHMSVRRWQDNAELVSIMNNPTSTWLYEWPQWQIYRPDLQRVIFDRANELPNVNILFGYSVADMNHETGTVYTAEGSTIKADLTVAADEIWSKSRRCWNYARPCIWMVYASASGRVVLIGDAAHALLPHAGQGAGMAMEDVASLAEFVGFSTSKDNLSTTMSA